MWWRPWGRRWRGGWPEWQQSSEYEPREPAPERRSYDYPYPPPPPPWWAPWIPPYPWPPLGYRPPLSLEEEIAMLEDYKRILEEELREIQEELRGVEARIKELKELLEKKRRAE